MVDPSPFPETPPVDYHAGLGEKEEAA